MRRWLLTRTYSRHLHERRVNCALKDFQFHTSNPGAIIRSAVKGTEKTVAHKHNRELQLALYVGVLGGNEVLLVSLLLVLVAP